MLSWQWPAFVLLSLQDRCTTTVQTFELGCLNQMASSTARHNKLHLGDLGVELNLGNLGRAQHSSAKFGQFRPISRTSCQFRSLCTGMGCWDASPRLGGPLWTTLPTLHIFSTFHCLFIFSTFHTLHIFATLHTLHSLHTLPPQCLLHNQQCLSWQENACTPAFKDQIQELQTKLIGVGQENASPLVLSTKYIYARKYNS